MAQPKVLVIDDSPLSLRLVAGFLATIDVQVLTAGSGEEGLATARAERPDLVLCDIVLPGRDGYSVLADLRADPALADTPVVMMTGVTGHKDRMKAINCGADDLLTKPFDLAEVTSRVKALLRLKRREDALREANARLRERIYLLSTLFVVGHQVHESLQPQDVYRVIRETLQTIVGADQFSIYVRVESPACLPPDEAAEWVEPTRFRLAAAHGLSAGACAKMDGWDETTAAEPIAAVLATGEPYYHSGPAETWPLFHGHPIAAAVPLVACRRVIGLINIHSFAAHRGDSADFELVSMLSGQVAGAIHALRMQTELSEYAGRLTEAGEALEETQHTLEEQMFHRHTLMLFSAQLHAATDVPETLAAVNDLLVNFVGAASYRLIYFDQGEPHVTVGAAPGCEAALPVADPTGQSQTASTAGTDVIDRVMATGEPLFRPRAGIFAAVPLLLAGEARGVLLVERLLPHKVGLSGEDMELLSLLAQHVAIALFTAYSRERQEARRRDFYAMLAHDFRSPLATQSLGFELLDTGLVGPLNADQKDIVGSAIAVNGRLVGLVDDFLAYSQIEAGALQLTRESTDLVALLRESADEMRRLVENREQTLELKLPDHPVELWLDRLHMKRAVANLLANAQKYSPTGGRIEVSLTDTTAEVQVHVKDDGPGIPPNELLNLFQRYYRIHGEHNVVRGTGLGLVIVKEVVEAHGGRAWVESAGVPGEGSTFSFALPSSPAP
jgi:signal transduction histidine kinase/FixJ family two-component response regulator